MAIKVFYKGKLIEGIEIITFEFPQNEFMKDAKSYCFAIEKKQGDSIFEYYMHRGSRYFFRSKTGKLVVTVGTFQPLKMKYKDLFNISMQ